METQIINESQHILTIQIGEGMHHRLLPGEEISVPDAATVMAPYVNRPTIHITGAREVV
jgi:hypothetical protein